MKEDNGLAIALFAAVIGGAVALAIATDVTAPLCDAAKIKSMAPDKIEFGCLEFWLNRYQTTTQTIVSGVIGGVGLFFVLKQLSALAHQNEMTRAALEATLRAQKIADGAARARAGVAIESYAAGTALLVKASKSMLAKKKVDLSYFEFWQGMRERQADISAGFTDADSSHMWSTAREEFDILMSYFSAIYRSEPVRGISMIYPHLTVPNSEPEALERLVKLQVEIMKLRSMLLQ